MTVIGTMWTCGLSTSKD